MPQISLQSPVGPLTLTENEGVITEIAWGWSRDAADTGLLTLARQQLAEYFDGERRDFALPLAPAGSDFQRGVWSAMMRIPYGETQSYGELADAVGSAPRAVAGACGRNPIPIIIPCHRVIGADGALTGYSGGEGIATKRTLLHHEARDAPRLL